MIVIIGVVAAMLIKPMADSWGASNLRESAQQLLVAAQYARAYAATRGRSCRLALNPKTGEFCVVAELDPSKPGQFQPVRADLNRKRTLTSGVRFGAIIINPLSPEGPGTDRQHHGVTFEPMGSADAAVIELTDGSRSWCLRIAPSTGRAELIEGRSKELFTVRIDLDV